MNFMKSFIQQTINKNKKVEIENAEKLEGQHCAEEEKENQAKMKTSSGNNSMDKLCIQPENENFMLSNIHILFNLDKFKRKPFRPKTLKAFKQSNISQKKSLKQSKKQKSRQIIPFIQPQFFVKTLFQQHSLTIKINQIKYYSSTRKGLRNFETLQNQDIIMTERIANIFKVFSIFDGHGQYGKLVAEVSAGYFRNSLKSYEEEFRRQISQKQIVIIVKNCIKKTQQYLNNFKFNQIQYSGTTALIVLISPRSIISFNIGNSRLVLGMAEENTQKIYDFQVTHDHDLNRLDERIRIKQTGAIISPLKDQLGQNFGPDRIWNKNQKRPGTFITRALGLTCGSKCGIISDPQVSIITYNKRIRFLVLASDGLWSVQQNDQVIAYLERYYRQNQLGMGVPSLIQQATARWKRKTQLMDDISIIAVGLSQEK